MEIWRLQTGILVAFYATDSRTSSSGIRSRQSAREGTSAHSFVPKLQLNCIHVALANGIRNAVYCYGAHWLPIALDSHSMGMASIMALLEILQKEQGRLHRWRVLRR